MMVMYVVPGLQQQSFTLSHLNASHCLAYYIMNTADKKIGDFNLYIHSFEQEVNGKLE